MPDLAQGNFANVILAPGESVRVSTSGQATVAAEYGAPAGTTTLNANTQVFGPYSVPAKLRVTAVTGACSYAAPVLVPAQVDASTGQLAPPASVSGAWLPSGAGSPSSFALSLMGSGNSPGASSLSTAQTWQGVWGIDKPVLALRYWHFNPFVASYVIGKAVGGWSDSWNSSKTPTNSTPFNVTYAGGSTTGTVPAGTGTDVGYLASDLIYTPSLARADIAGAPYLLHSRVYIDGTGGNSYPYFGVTGNANFSGNNDTGLARSFGQVAGDTTAFADTAATYTNGNSLLMGVEFITEARFIRVMALGDSNTSNVNATAVGATRYSRAARIAALLNASLPLGSSTFFTAINAGWGSQNSTTYLARLPALLTQFKPDIVVIPVISSNNIPATQAQADDTWGRFLNAVGQCKAAGASVVVTTGFARNSQTSAQDGFRKALNARAIAWARSYRVPFADIAPLIDTSAVPAQITPAYDSGDGLHLNGAGIDVDTAAVAAAIAAGPQG